MYTLGLDFGSTASKGIILEDGKKIAASKIISSGTGTKGPARVLESLFEESGLKKEDMAYTIVTGYGRMKHKEAEKQLSELSCHAKGVSFLFPDARTVIDIGGQDAKALKLEDGKLQSFMMNDKCAAGTGRFLDVMANILDVDINDLGPLSEKSEEEIAISNTCTVFAESEVISKLSTDAKIEDIIAGIHTSVAGRVAALAKRVGVRDRVVMVGGVAKNQGVVRALEKALNTKIYTHELAQLTGALGAALYAYEEYEKSKGEK